MRFLFLLLPLAFGACNDDAEPSEESSKTPIGDFLAGQYALNHGDPEEATAFFKSGLEDSTKDPHILAAYLRALILEGNGTEALKVAQKLSVLNPKNFLSHLTLLMGDLKTNNTSTALKRLKTLDQFYAFHGIKPFIEAWVLAFSGRAQKALKTLLPFAEETGHIYPRYRFHTALILDYLGLNSAALEHIQKITSLQNAAPPRMLETIYHLKGLDLSLQKIIAQLLKNNVDPLFIGKQNLDLKKELTHYSAEIFLDFALKFSEEGNPETGLIFAKCAAFLMPKNPYKDFILGDIYLTLQNDDEALKAFQKISVLSPYYPLGQFRSAGILMNKGSLSRASTILETLSKTYPSWPNLYLTHADLLAKNKDYKEAIFILSQALELFDVDLQAKIYYKRSLLYEKQERFQDQESDLHKALTLTPHDPYILNYLAYIQAERHFDLKGGLELAVQAAKLLPHDGAILDTLGWIYHRLEKEGEALTMLEKAHKIAPEDGQIAEHLGDIYMALDRRSDAQFMYEKAIDATTHDDEKNKLKVKSMLAMEPASNQATENSNTPAPLSQPLKSEDPEKQAL